MKIESERLIFYPIENDETLKLIENEKDPEMKQAYSEMLQGCIEHPGNRIWYTVWYMELRSEPGTVIGDFCFKGLNENSMVEIGYGLRDGYCGHGYMTEAVKKISEWALHQKGVTKVEAETEPDNTASQNVLIKAGYFPSGIIGEEGPRYVFQKTD